MNMLQLRLRNQWDLFLSLITLICLVLSWQVEIKAPFEWIWVGLLLLLTGIPHGATDHLVYWHKLTQIGKEKSWLNFLAMYFAQMILYAGLWMLFPLVSFGIFLLLTSYHFGQSQLYYIDLAEKKLIKKIIYILWGASTMTIILLGHSTETITYLNEILPQSWLDPVLWDAYYPRALGILSPSLLGGLVYLFFKGKIAYPDFIREIGVSILLGLTLHYCSLWIGFGLYFGLWHATKAIRAEISLMKQEDSEWSLKNWILAALPFSIISILGLTLLVFTWYIWGADWHPVFLFFVGISMLTLPHMTTLEHVYKNQV